MHCLNVVTLDTDEGELTYVILQQGSLKTICITFQELNGENNLQKIPSSFYQAFKGSPLFSFHRLP